MTKLTVQTPYGTATRTSDRPYQFVVVSCGQSESYLLGRHQAAAAYSAKLASQYRTMAAGPGMSDARIGQLLGWATDAEASAAKPFVMPAPKFTVHGWSQSYNGASKMAADANRHGALGIHVVPVDAPSQELLVAKADHAAEARTVELAQVCDCGHPRGQHTPDLKGCTVLSSPKRRARCRCGGFGTGGRRERALPAVAQGPSKRDVAAAVAQLVQELESPAMAAALATTPAATYRVAKVGVNYFRIYGTGPNRTKLADPGSWDTRVAAEAAMAHLAVRA